ncbi:macro domain-containing protein [Luxibacter massiliensis]|uniref:macro domain-containing protein n=1 Tax=Luxibacter massiliensis TaxID=2219695 RepID=UPI002ED44FDB
MGIIVSGWEGAYYIAFCCISTGKFHFPNKDAAEIAIKEVQAYIIKSSKEIKIF